MVIKCPACDGALEFDAGSGMMYCRFCASYYSADQISVPMGNWGREEASNQTQNTSFNTNAQQSSSWAPAENAPKQNSGWVPYGYTPQQTVIKEERPKFQTFDEMQDVAERNRSEGRTGNLSYFTDEVERQKNIDAFYTEQQKLHEEYQNLNGLSIPSLSNLPPVPFPFPPLTTICV